MDLYRDAHSTLLDKVADMGTELVVLTLLYSFGGAACIAWSVRLLLATGVDDLLADWPGVAWGVAGVLLCAVGIGVWCRFRWAFGLAMFVHWSMVVWGSISMKAPAELSMTDPAGYKFSIWTGFGMVFVSLLFAAWWQREEVRGWTRVPGDAP